METPIPACPKCKSANVKRYAYGLIRFSSKEEEEEFRKENILGGCVIGEESPHYYCTDCKKDF